MPVASHADFKKVTCRGIRIRRHRSGCLLGPKWRHLFFEKRNVRTDTHPVIVHDQHMQHPNTRYYACGGHMPGQFVWFRNQHTNGMNIWLRVCIGYI